MTTRRGWTVESVRALNIIDVVFCDDKKVRAAWKKYYDTLCLDKEELSDMDSKRITDAQYELLETMAVALGYKDKITWKTIQNPYVPKGMIVAEQNQQLYQDTQLSLIQMMYSQFSQFTSNMGPRNDSKMEGESLS